MLALLAGGCLGIFFWERQYGRKPNRGVLEMYGGLGVLFLAAVMTLLILR
jgi:hypothetical protein